MPLPSELTPDILLVGVDNFDSVCQQVYDSKEKTDVSLLTTTSAAVNVGLLLLHCSNDVHLWHDTYTYMYDRRAYSWKIERC